MEERGVDEYRLSCVLQGHSQDVRCLADVVLPAVGGEPISGILSGSRDATVRVWVPEAHTAAGYTELLCLRGHSGFVYAVALLLHGQGESATIFTAGQDKTIRAYSSPGFGYAYTLTAHEDTVSCLSASSEFNLLVSGSWDKTVRMWTHGSQVCQGELTGHTAAVWAVAILPTHASHHARILSASADQSVRLWEDGNIVRIFSGHTDAVRALQALSPTEFLSAANDHTVRLWCVDTGTCLREFVGHENYIYSISLLPGIGFLTGGEDSTVRVWTMDSTKALFTQMLPAHSVWAVAGLPNGDFACASSDGLIRIFSADRSRWADEGIREMFEQDIAAFLTADTNQDEIGGIKITDLPGPEILQMPGKHDGQQKMVRVGAKVELHQWSNEEGEWKKTGDVLSGKAPAKGKKMYLGQEYDYVFEVDTEEGKPALKLPYNVSEDPWFAAQRFIDKNMLPQVYLDQVAHFIITNAPGAGQAAKAEGIVDPLTGGNRYVPGGMPSSGDANGFADPLTGGGRYIPGYASASNGSASQDMGDPLTASGRYIPANASTDLPPQPGVSIDWRRPRSDHIPLHTPIAFKTVSAAALIGRLETINRSVAADLQLSDNQMESLGQLAHSPITAKITDTELRALERGLKWPTDQLVPVLDLLRLVVLRPEGAQHFFSKQHGPVTVDLLCQLLANSPNLATSICVARCLSNAFSQPTGQALLVNCKPIRTLMTMELANEKPALQIACASTLANLAATLQCQEHTDERNNMMSEIVKHFSVEKMTVIDHQAMFVMCQVFGTLMWGAEACIVVARNLNIGRYMERAKDALEDDTGKHLVRTIERMLLGREKY